MHILVIPSWYLIDDYPIRGIFFKEQALSIKNYGNFVGIIKPEPRSLLSIFNKKDRKLNGLVDTIEDGIQTIRYYTWYFFPKIPYGNSFIWKFSGEILFSYYIKKYGKPDIIHAQSTVFAGYLAYIIKKKYGIPYILTEHSSMFSRGMIKGWLKKVVGKVFKNASELTVVSNSTGQIIENMFKTNFTSWSKIPNFIEGKFSSTYVTHNQNTDKYLNIGVMNENKNQSLLIDAFYIAFKNNSNITLRIGGNGPLRDTLEKKVITYGLQEQVIFLGELTRDEVKKELNTCDFLVHSSNSETFGIILIEALAFGNPIVSTSCGGPDEIITSLNGLLVPIGDVEKYKDALLKIRAMKFDREEIRMHCLNTYSEDVVVSKIISLYQRCLKK